MIIVEIMIVLNVMVILSNQCQNYYFDKKIDKLTERVNNLDRDYR